MQLNKCVSHVVMRSPSELLDYFSMGQLVLKCLMCVDHMLAAEEKQKHYGWDLLVETLAPTSGV